jgi:hypothetical protein
LALGIQSEWWVNSYLPLTFSFQIHRYWIYATALIRWGFNLYPKNHNPGTEAVREIRDEIKARVEALLTELLK